MSEPYYARKPVEPADQRRDANPVAAEPVATGVGVRTRAWSLRTLAAVAITTVALSGAAGAGLAAAGGGESGGRGGFGGPPGMGRPGQLGGQPGGQFGGQPGGQPGGQLGGQLGGQTGGQTGAQTGRLSGFWEPSGRRPVRAFVPGQLPPATAPGTEYDV